jgi:hypothetical protein
MIRTIAAGALLSAAMPALGQNVTAQDPQSVVKALQDAGYRAELKAEADGAPYIVSGAGGAKFSVLFFDCEKAKACKSLQFYSGWTDKVTAQQMNDWNRDHRFGRAYVDDKGEAAIEFDVDFEGAPMPVSLFRSNVETWATVLGAFQKFLVGVVESK